MSSECLFRGYIKNDKMTSGNSMSSECLCPECLLKFTEARKSYIQSNKGIIRCGVKVTMVDLAVPGYFSKKMKQPMKILMLLRIFLFVEF